MEWKLWEGTEPAHFSTAAFFEGHDWIPGSAQVGHAIRVTVAADVLAEQTEGPFTDLGCGDGSLLAAAQERGVTGWGYDLGDANRRYAAAGTDVRYADVVTDLESLDLAAVVSATEMLEHLTDPHRLLRRLAALPVTNGLFSVPAGEDDVRHYEHHAWAWDLDGFHQLLDEAGWTVLRVETCEASDPHWGDFAWQVAWTANRS